MEIKIKDNKSCSRDKKIKKPHTNKELGVSIGQEVKRSTMNYQEKNSFQRNKTCFNKDHEYEIVYHESFQKHLESILCEGILPNVHANHEAKLAYQWTDNYRLDWQIGIGLSRSNSIFCFPDLEFGNGFTTSYKSIYLELRVDPKKCFVGEMETVTEVFMRNSDIKRAIVFASSYWEDMITLKDFIRYYEKKISYHDESLAFYRRKSAPDELLGEFRIPEVLVPYRINPKDVKLVKTKINYT